MKRLGPLLTVCLILVVHPATAQETPPPTQTPPPPLTQQDLARLRDMATDGSLDQDQRQAAADEAIQLRREMLRRDGFGQYAAKIQIEQAAALLARLSRDGSDSAVLFGLALPTQRSRVAQTAAETIQLLAEARDQIRVDIARIGRIPPDDLTDEQEEDRWIMTKVDLETRIPFFAGRAALLMAATAPTPIERAQHAADAITTLEHLYLSDPGANIARLVNLATARLARGGDQNAQLARNHFLQAAQQARADVQIPIIIQAEALFGLLAVANGTDEAIAIASRVRSKLDGLLADSNPDPLLEILSTDAITRALVHAARSPDGRWDPIALGHAFRSQIDLQNRTDLGIDSEIIRAMVMEKMGAIIQPGMPLDVIPIEGIYARATLLARSPGNRDQAISLLDRVIVSTRDSQLRNDALQAKAAALSTSTNPEEQLQAAQAMFTLSRRTGGSDRSTQTLWSALMLVRPLVENPDLPEAQGLYIQALNRATASPSIRDLDTWRYERARLIVEDMGQYIDPMAQGDAMSLLIRIRQSAPVYAQAVELIAYLYAAQIDDAWSRLQTARRTGHENEAQRIATDQLEPAARAALIWSEKASKPNVVRFLMDMADAKTESGDRRARYVYERLLEKENIPQGSLIRVRFGYARSLLLEKEPEKAFALLLQIAQELESQTMSPPRLPTPPTRQFWHAWTLLLETLQNQGDARAATVATHIKRLKSLDPELGGKPWSTRIATVKQWAN